MEIEDELYERITELSGRGDKLSRKGRVVEALPLYREALDLVPEPKDDYQATYWLLTAIGDAQYLMDDFEAAAETLARANEVQSEIEDEMNPFILLRLGQSLYEVAQAKQDAGLLGDAADCLARVYLSEGEEMFFDEHWEHLQFVKSRLRPAETEKKGLKKLWPFGR